MTRDTMKTFGPSVFAASAAAEFLGNDGNGETEEHQGRQAEQVRRSGLNRPPRPRSPPHSSTSIWTPLASSDPNLGLTTFVKMEPNV